MDFYTVTVTVGIPLLAISNKIDKKVTIERFKNRSIPSINGIIEKLSNVRNFFFFINWVQLKTPEKL